MIKPIMDIFGETPYKWWMKPYINFIDTNIGDRIEDIDISISHCKKYAVSNVVLVLK